MCELVAGDIDDVCEAAEDLSIAIAICHQLMEVKGVEESGHLIVIIVDTAHKFEALVVNRISAKNFPVEVIGLLELLEYVPCARVLWAGDDMSLLKEFPSTEFGFSPAGTVYYTVVVQIEGEPTFALAVPNCAM
jgi:hypothetical protein